MEVAALLITAEADPDGTLVIAGGFQCLDGPQGDDDAALHVQDTRAIGLVPFDAEGIFLEGAGVEYSVKMSGEDHRLARASGADLTRYHRRDLRRHTVNCTVHPGFPEASAEVFRLGVHGVGLPQTALMVHQCLPVL